MSHWLELARMDDMLVMKAAQEIRINMDKSHSWLYNFNASVIYHQVAQIKFIYRNKRTTSLSRYPDENNDTISYFICIKTWKSSATTAERLYVAATPATLRLPIQSWSPPCGMRPWSRQFWLRPSMMYSAHSGQLHFSKMKLGRVQSRWSFCVVA